MTGTGMHERLETRVEATFGTGDLRMLYGMGAPFLVMTGLIIAAARRRGRHARPAVAASPSARASVPRVYHSPGRRNRGDQRVGAAEIVCIVAAVAAIVALMIWIIANAGGGALMT